MQVVIRGLAWGVRDGALLIDVSSLREMELDPITNIVSVSPAITSAELDSFLSDQGVLREWAAWDLRFGILSKPLDVSQAFDFDQVGPVRNP